MKAVATAAVLAILTHTANAGHVLERIQQTRQITIAHRETSVPLSYVVDGRPVGYAVELCNKIAAAVKTRLKLQNLDVAYLKVDGGNRIQAIAESKADLECGSTTNNAERRKLVAFTVPHYIAGARYLVRTADPISELSGFEGKRLASTKGTTPLKAIRAANAERLLRIDVVEVPDHGKAVDMLEAGQVDGFAMDDVLLFGLRSERKNPDRMKVVGKFLTIEPLAIMLNKDDAEFKKLVDEEMKRLIASREAYAIYEKWFMQPIPPRNVSLNMPMNYLLKDFWKYPTAEVPN